MAKFTGADRFRVLQHVDKYGFFEVNVRRNSAFDSAAKKLVHEKILMRKLTSMVDANVFYVKRYEGAKPEAEEAQPRLGYKPQWLDLLERIEKEVDLPEHFLEEIAVLKMWELPPEDEEQ